MSFEIWMLCYFRYFHISGSLLFKAFMALTSPRASKIARETAMFCARLAVYLVTKMAVGTWLSLRRQALWRTSFLASTQMKTL